MIDMGDKTMNLFGYIALAAEGTSGGGTGDLLSMILPFGILILVMYFLMIRPQQKAEKKKREMLNSIKKDDNVVTIGGIYGTVTDVNEDEDIVTIAVGPDRVKFMVKKGAIATIDPVEEPDEDDDIEVEETKQIEEAAETEETTEEAEA